MVKTRKTRKAVEEDETVEETVETPTEVVTPPYVPKPTPAKVIPPPPPPKEFTAILQDASTLTLAGIKFARNEPTRVPMAHLKLIRGHGWFRVSV